MMEKQYGQQNNPTGQHPANSNYNKQNNQNDQNKQQKNKQNDNNYNR